MTAALFRSKMTTLSPGILAFGFWLIHSDAPWENRVAAAFGAAVALNIVTLLGGAIAPLLVDWMLGDAAPQDPVPPQRYLIGAALLATTMWMFLQNDKAAMREELADCADEVMRESPRQDFSAREAVLYCYEVSGQEWFGPDD